MSSENRLPPLQATKPGVVRNLFKTDVYRTRESPSTYDRFIPCRANNNWVTSFATIPDLPKAGQSAQKKARENGDTPRESSAYNCLLRNELLSENIEDVKLQCDERQACTPTKNKNLFKYGTQVTPSKVSEAKFKLITIWKFADKCFIIRCTLKWVPM